MLVLAAVAAGAQAQDRLYGNAFALGEVRLLDGPFKHAQDLNLKVLLQYDTDRLLEPFLREAGLPPKGEPFTNWDGLSGHVGGHYLSALAIHYAATGNAECKRRMDYMLSELKRCQLKNGDGYVGGVPGGKRLWSGLRKGDVVEVSLPMGVTVEELPNVPEYIAIMRGPILMGARMGTDDLRGLVAGDGRWEHIASGRLVPVYDTPFIIGSRDGILDKLNNMRPVDGKPMCFSVPGLFGEGRYKDLVLEPFYKIHDSRYMMYWLSMDEKGYGDYIRRLKADEERRIELDRRTVDVVRAGEQQPEADHRMTEEKSSKGYHENLPWREADDGGHFSYTLSTGGNGSLALMVGYWGNEPEGRTFDILVDGRPLAVENLHGKWKEWEFTSVEYPIPADMLEGKDEVVVTFRPHPGNKAGRVFSVRLVTE